MGLMKITPTDAIASLALLLTLYQLWVTSMRRGRVRMTRPTWIAFTHDVSSAERSDRRAKVYLRAMLYSTGARGHVVESMYVRLRWMSAGIEHHRTFSFWVLGEERLARGSGLYVGPTGLALNHHFVLSEHEPAFGFAQQRYTIEVYASVVGREPKQLFASDLLLSSEEAASIIRDGSTGFFNWEPEEGRYSTHVKASPADAMTPILIDV